MRRNFCSVSAFIVIFMLNSACFGEVLNIVTTEFCPYVCDPKKEGGFNGFVIDIFNTVFKKNGYQVKYEIQPWARALKTFNDNKGYFDGLIAATKIHPIDKNIAVFPKTEICMYTHKFYTAKDSPLIGKWKYNGLKSLSNIKLSGIKGWSYCNAEITKYINEAPEPKVYSMYGEDLLPRNIKMLFRKRVDIYIENEFMMSYLLYNEKKVGKPYADNIVVIDSVPVDKGMGESYPVFYKDNTGKKYAELFTEGVKELRANGKMDEILAKYGLEDWR